MALVNRPDFSIKWAEAGNVLEPATEKRELGHVVEKPPYEIVNWIENNQDNGIAYLMQEGISDWSLDQDYSATSLVKYDGIVYKAKVASIGKQPDIETAVWEIAFVDYGDYVDLTNDLYNTKNTAGYAANLVYKNAPVMTARADGTSYKADIGTSLTPTDNVGYVFDGKETDGIFHDGSKAVAQNNGAVVAEFGDASTNSSGLQVVTKDFLKKSLEFYKVNDIYITLRDGNPADTLGYGTWARFAEGRTLVSFASASSTAPVWSKFIGNTYGEYDHVLSIDEMPSHNHTTTFARELMSRGTNATYGDEAMEGYDTRATSSSGGNSAHNNVQPSIVVYMWLRTA